MTKKQMNRVVSILLKFMEERENELWSIKTETISSDIDHYNVNVKLVNTAYRHELNAIVMAMEGCRLCDAMLWNEPGIGVYWNLY